MFMWDTGSSLSDIGKMAKKAVTADFKPTRPFRFALGSEDFKVGVPGCFRCCGGCGHRGKPPCQVAFFNGPPFKNPSFLEDHSNFVNCVRFSPDGEYLATASSDKSILLYDAKVRLLRPLLLPSERPSPPPCHGIVTDWRGERNSVQEKRP